jgi:hypothetical protein
VSARAHLRPVGDALPLVVLNTETGEQTPLSDYVQALEDQISGLQRDIRGWTTRYEELKRDKRRAAKQHPLYADAETAFKHWRAACNHPNSQFTADRFWLIEPFLENPKYGLGICMRAVEGAAYDCWEVKRKNGSTKRFDEWERIFKNTGSVEEYANRAPRKKLETATEPPTNC